VIYFSLIIHLVIICPLVILPYPPPWCFPKQGNSAISRARMTHSTREHKRREPVIILWLSKQSCKDILECLKFKPRRRTKTVRRFKLAVKWIACLFGRTGTGIISSHLRRTFGTSEMSQLRPHLQRKLLTSSVRLVGADYWKRSENYLPRTRYKNASICQRRWKIYFKNCHQMKIFASGCDFWRSQSYAETASWLMVCSFGFRGTNVIRLFTAVIFKFL